MAQDFASDNSGGGLFDRLKFNRHRGFFSFIFITLSIIFILVTYSAIQQQQTTQSRAAGSCSCTAEGQGCSVTGSIPCEGFKCSPVGPGSTIGECESTTGAGSVKLGEGDQCEIGSTTRICNPDLNLYCKDVGAVGQYGVCRERDTSCVANGSSCITISNNSSECCSKNCTYVDERGTKACQPSTTPECQDYTGYVGHPGANQCQQAGGGCQTSPTCSTIAVGTTCSFNGKPGKYVGGLCPGGTETRCCVPGSTGEGGSNVTNTPTPPGGGGQAACNNFTTQATCLPTTECIWINNNCSRVCSRIAKRNNCTRRADCEWRNNACVIKTNGGGGSPTITTTPGGGGGSPTVTTTPGGGSKVNITLKLAFQGIVELPKTKTEVRIKVKIVDAANKERISDGSKVTADENGIWTGKVTYEDVDLSQKYYLLIKGPMHVQKKVCQKDAADPNPGYYSCQFGNIKFSEGDNEIDLSKVKTLVGDLPIPKQDRVVNSEDTATILNALLLPIEERQGQEVLDKADLNLDGIVSTQDWGLMLEGLKVKYDEK